MKSIVVVPTYNERENVEKVVDLIRRQPGHLHVLIADDNSPDGTGQIADRLSETYPGEVLVLHRERKEGLGRAYVAAFQYLLSNYPYEAIMQMDADLSHDPAFLPEMLEKLEKADLVLGSRYLRGVAVVNWDFKRLILSKCATKYAQLVTGMPFTDATGGFKCWRRETLEAIGLERLFSSGYLFQIETTYRAYKMGFRIAETPIIFYERTLGKSKIDLGIILEAVAGVVKLRLTRGR